MKPEHDWRRREVGCQSDPAEMRDASIQVDLLTGQFSGRCSGGCGAQWHCVSIREDAGDGLLQHINLSLPQTAGSPALYLLYTTILPTNPLCSKSASNELMHRCSLPSMLQCSVFSSKGAMCDVPSPADVPAVPPGLIAPLSPCLAEEEEEEEREKHLSEQEKNKGLSADQLTLKPAKRKKMFHVSNPKSCPTDSLSNRTARKPPPGRKSLCNTVHQMTKMMKDDGNKNSPTEQEEEKHQETCRKPSAGIKHSPVEEGGAGQGVAGGGVKPETCKTEHARRPRRTMVHPPIRYLPDYGEESHVLLSARTQLKKNEIKMQQIENKDRKMDPLSTEGQRDNTNMESEDGGGPRWRQRCRVCGLSFTSWTSLQLHLSVHRRGQTISCQLCNRRFSCSRSLQLHYHRHQSGFKTGRHGGRSRAKLWRDETGETDEVEQVPKWPRFAELTVASDWLRRKSDQLQNGWMECKRKRCRKEKEEEVKQVCVEINAIGQEEKPQRPRRRMVGPPLRYLLESEELSRGPITTYKTRQNDDKIKHVVGAQEEVIRKDMERQGGPITTETHKRHMVAGEDEEKIRKAGIEINEEEEPQRLRRKMVCPPIRYLLQSEKPSHGPITTNQNPQNKPKQVRRRTTLNSDAEGEMIDSSESVRRQKRHMISEREPGHMMLKEGGEEECQKPSSIMVSPPIQNLVEFEKLSHGIVPLHHNTENIRQSLDESMKVVSHCDAEGITDGPKDVARSTSDGAMKEKRDEEDGKIHHREHEKVEEPPQRPRRKMVGPPIRYLLQSEELSHSYAMTNQTTENKDKQSAGKTKEAEYERDFYAVASTMIGRSDKQTCHVTSGKQTVCIASKEERNEEPQRPRRKMVGPPIRYLLESEKELYSALPTNHNIRHSFDKPKKVVGDNEPVGGALNLIDSPKDVARQTGHKPLTGGRDDEGRRIDVGNEKEQPQRPRRKTVGPPIRYLLESEELSHGGVAANQNTQDKPKQSSGKLTQADGESIAEGVSSQMIDMSEVVDTSHIISKEEREEPQRRKMVGPLIGNLFQSEERSHDIVATSHLEKNKSGQSLERLQKVVNVCDAGGGASEMIDRSKDVAKQTSHVVLKDKREEEDEGRMHEGNDEIEKQLQRPIRISICPPTRYSLESEEVNHDSNTAHNNAKNDESSGIFKRVVGESGASKMIDMSEMIDEPKGHIDSHRESCPMVSRQEREEEPQKPRRKMIGPPIRYLLESERPSHGGVTTNHNMEIKIRRISRKSKIANESGAEGLALEMIDSPEDVATQTSCTVSQEETDVEERKHGEGNEGVDKQPQRPRRETVGPPIQYLLQSKEQLLGAVTAIHNADVSIAQGLERSKKLDGDGVGGALKMIDSSQETCPMNYNTEIWTYLAYRDLQSGQVTIILPCFVRLQRLL